MKTVKILLFFLGAVCALQSCKKGEDDPFLSLRSRKARVAGKWKMTSMTSSSNGTYSSFTSSSSFSSNGSTYTSSYTSGGSTTNGSGTYSSNFEFKKDGTFELSYIEDGITTKRTGTWDFNTGVGKTKGKTEIKLNVLSNSDPSGTVTISGRYYNEVYELKELRNKKMVLINKYSYAGTGSTESYETEIKFEAD